MNERYIILGDYRIWFMIAAKYPMYMIQEALTYYRRHATNLSKSSWELAFRNAIEFERIMRDIIVPLDKKTFIRSFYPNLIFKKIETEEDFLAEKFMLLANGASTARRQAAIDFYFDHCSNRAFTRLLENKYGFSNDDFTHMKDCAGITNTFNEIAVGSGYEPLIEQKEVRTYHAWKHLLKAIQSGRFHMEELCDFRWSSVYQLSDLRNSGEGTLRQFQNVKLLLQKMRELLRKQMGRRKVLFMVAASSDWRLNSGNTPIPPEENVDYYVAYINKIDVLLAKDISSLMNEKNDSDISNIQYLDLFDNKEQCLVFADEIIDRLTDICYVDCLQPVYECYEMMRGYSLGCSQMAIMDKTMYDAMMEVDETTMQVMDAVYYYE